ncbi:MAG: hypothetical protein EP343_32590 [Deltaproteobacteria bacterium]|nr:MAG: hypothetical protein EP343_32590 [Deltaproteobacteria bacterium]
MNIKDPGLRRTFEGMLNDGVIDKNEALRMLQSVSDYGVVTETEQADLLRILNELGDSMTSDAKQTLEQYLGVAPSTPPADAPPPQGGTSALNVTLQALQGKDLSSLNLTESRSIFRAAEKGGISKLEARKLSEVYNKYSSQWSTSVREFWRNGIASARRPAGGIVRPPTGAAEPEDLSSDLKTLWMQGYDDEVQRAFVEDMVLVAAEKGMKVTLLLDSHIDIEELAWDLTDRTGLSLTELDSVLDVIGSDGYPSVWGEDNRILTDGNDITEPVKVLVPPQIYGSSLTKAMLFSADEGYHPTQPGSFQGAVAERGEGYYSSEMASSLGRDAVTTSTYIEGGNMVPGTTADGKPYALVGRDSLLISTFDLDDKGTFSSSKVRAKVRDMEAAGEFSSSKVESIARKLVATELAYDHNWIDPYLNSPDLLPSRVPIDASDLQNAKNFLAKMELTKELMADDVGIDVERLIYVDQPEFHIDMSMRPLGPGEVMVHHPQASIDLINEALQDPQLRSWERKELLEMRSFAQYELQEHGDIYDKIIDQLEDAGLLVEEAPGNFRSNSRQANFMNAVPGRTPDGKNNYIVIGSSIKPLERAFSRFIKDYGVDDVTYVGGNYTEDGLTAGEISLELAGGIDCRESSHGGTDNEAADLLRAYINNL